MAKAEPVFKRLLQEIHQGHELRRNIYSKLEVALGGEHRVVSVFTSFRYPVILEDSDADMLEEVLSTTDLDGRRLMVVLNCPGGDGMAAERIVNICRTFGNNHFSVIVPKMAKSAATMVCLGADEIIMSSTSELGPIDPQILIRNERGEPEKYQAAHEILESFYYLLGEANTTKGRIEPYLQQLARFDARDIRNIESAQDLSESIAVGLLKKCMMKGLTDAQIKKKIKLLTDPRETKDHGRALFHDAAKKCGLNVTTIDNKHATWRLVWELYLRLNSLTNSHAAKVIETVDESYTASP